MVAPEWASARPPEAQGIWDEILRPVAAGLEQDANRLSHEMLDYIGPHLPELFPDPESVEENRASAEASIRAAARMLETGSDPERVPLPPATVAYVQESARRGVPFPSLLRSYRLGHEAMTDELVDRIAEAADPKALAAATKLCNAWVFGFVDAALTASEEVYDAEQERWLHSAAASRAETIRAILSGRQRDPGLASKRLGYRLDGEHVGAIAWLDAAPDGANPIARLERDLEQVGNSIGAERRILHPLGLLAVAAWFRAPAGFDSAALERAGADRRPDRVRIAIGEPGDGLDGFRRTHEEAAQARRVASLAGLGAGTLTRYDQVALRSLATANLPEAREFVERELGGLAANDDVSVRLAATLRAYLDELASRGRTAKRLGIHENTVSNRVRQAEEVLGRPVEERNLELRVALAIADLVRSADGATA